MPQSGLEADDEEAQAESDRDRHRGSQRREPFKVTGLSSFGEDARGELFLTSLDSGAVYRLAG